MIMYRLINIHKCLLMNINEKVKKLQKIIKIKFVIPSERPIYTPEYLKLDLNGSL